MAFLFAFFPVVIATMGGLAGTPAHLVEHFRAIRAPAWTTFRRLYAPSALPSIEAAPVRTLDAAETAAALPWGPLVEAMLRMFERERRGEARAAPRTAVPLAAGGTMLLMPAADAEFAALKTVTVHAGNAAHGLPVVQGEVVLLDAATGTRLLALDGNVLTARRTAALSLAGAMRAGRTGAEHVLLIDQRTRQT